MSKKGSVIKASGLCPDCEYSELGNDVAGSKAKGYNKTKECPKHIAQRATDVLTAGIQKDKEDANIMIARKAREIAKQTLISEGKLDSDENIIK